jgi:hypothetical protein
MTKKLEDNSAVITGGTEGIARSGNGSDQDFDLSVQI